MRTNYVPKHSRDNIVYHKLCGVDQKEDEFIVNKQIYSITNKQINMRTLKFIY